MFEIGIKVESRPTRLTDFEHGAEMLIELYLLRLPQPVVNEVTKCNVDFISASLPKILCILPGVSVEIDRLSQKNYSAVLSH